MIRRATRDDAELLARIQQQSSLAGYAHIFPPERYPYPVEAVRARWRAFDGWAVVCVRDGREVGFVTIDPPELNGLYVVPEAWGTGAAGELHDAAVEALREAGVVRAALWVLEASPRARRFYERRGWAADGEVRALSFPPHPVDLRYTRTV